ncbi:transposase [Rubinisphaera sp.]|uniref:REP-associated tyrosine transposase n=1 Tax=Rubinisphaera sp. TaxID=2024857 RepID=UPI000C0DD462|nr:transposase [Rubinisphaera sp.]MBV08385.1 hypothetical protein [Rubinisphaera sp.]HCS55587.1 hypothetical protein [Planctomycetaceae bacterium]|tara:strand:- start:1047 stop:1562 length:516 start_codon:yes stop_codon:yes gene_type:complete
MSDSRRQYQDQLYCHFVTFSCHRRRNLLQPDPPKRILLGKLNQQLSRQSATCVGFVVMPDHMHLLVWFPETGQISRFMQTWKRLSSHAIRKWWEENRQNYSMSFDLSEGIWTPKYFSFEVSEQQKLSEKLNYLHLNPVRAGLVDRAVDWKWSSARWYEQHRSVGVPIKWIE